MGESNDSIARRRNKRSAEKQDGKSKDMCFKTEPEKKRKRDSETNKKVARVKKGSPEKEIIKTENLENGNLTLGSSFSFMGPEIVINLGKPACKIIKRDGSWKEYGSVPSKYLKKCLETIQTNLQCGGSLSDIHDKPLSADEWGLEFWKCYTNGKDILENGGAHPTVEQIAWMASTAADTISFKEEEGLPCTDPFLLYLVPSRDKAKMVRKVCKPLRSVGIRDVSLRAGSSRDDQIRRLKNLEPEFLISTPERLLELVNSKDVDISGISLLVIDGVQTPCEGTYFDTVKYIRGLISGDLQTVVFCDCKNTKSNSVVQNLMGKDGSTRK